MDTSQTDSSIVGRLDALDVRERTVSARRKQLLDHIDILSLSAPLTTARAALLDRLEKQERAVSLHRYELHTRIDELRAEVGLPSCRETLHLDSAA